MSGGKGKPRPFICSLMEAYILYPALFPEIFLSHAVYTKIPFTNSYFIIKVIIVQKMSVLGQADRWYYPDL